MRWTSRDSVINLCYQDAGRLTADLEEVLTGAQIAELEQRWFGPATDPAIALAVQDQTAAQVERLLFEAGLPADAARDVANAARAKAAEARKAR